MKDFGWQAGDLAGDRRIRGIPAWRTLAVQLPLLEQYWQPFLESGSADADERSAALEAVAEGLLPE